MNIRKANIVIEYATSKTHVELLERMNEALHERINFACNGKLNKEFIDRILKQVWTVSEHQSPYTSDVLELIPLINISGLAISVTSNLNHFSKQVTLLTAKLQHPSRENAIIYTVQLGNWYRIDLCDNDPSFFGHMIHEEEEVIKHEPSFNQNVIQVVLIKTIQFNCLSQTEPTTSFVLHIYIPRQVEQTI